MPIFAYTLLHAADYLMPATIFFLPPLFSACYAFAAAADDIDGNGRR